MTGYGRNPPDPLWPGGAKVCVQFVVNYEEGGENNILHGDTASEAFLSEIVGAAAWPGQRHWNMESIYEYGARAGFWRLWRLFTARGIPATVFGVASALQRSPDQVAAMQQAGWEIASHGLKWIEYKDFTRDEERAHLREGLRVPRLQERAGGGRPSVLAAQASLQAPPLSQAPFLASLAQLSHLCQHAHTRVSGPPSPQNKRIPGSTCVEQGRSSPRGSPSIANLERKGCGGGSRDFLSMANQGDSRKPLHTHWLCNKNTSKNSSKTRSNL
jgi:hypothetical protein